MPLFNVIATQPPSPFSWEKRECGEVPGGDFGVDHPRQYSNKGRTVAGPTPAVQLLCQQRTIAPPQVIFRWDELRILSVH